MAGTPVTKLIETIKAVDVMQVQVDNLTRTLEALESRVNRLERQQAAEPQSGA